MDNTALRLETVGRRLLLSRGWDERLAVAGSRAGADLAHARIGHVRRSRRARVERIRRASVLSGHGVEAPWLLAVGLRVLRVGRVALGAGWGCPKAGVVVALVRRRGIVEALRLVTLLLHRGRGIGLRLLLGGLGGILLLLAQTEEDAETDDGESCHTTNDTTNNGANGGARAALLLLAATATVSIAAVVGARVIASVITAVITTVVVVWVRSRRDSRGGDVVSGRELNAGGLVGEGDGGPLNSVVLAGVGGGGLLNGGDFDGIAPVVNDVAVKGDGVAVRGGSVETVM